MTAMLLRLEIECACLVLYVAKPLDPVSRACEELDRGSSLRFLITFSEAQGSAAVECVDTGAAIGTGFLSHGMSGRVAGIAPKVRAVGKMNYG
jgi:hypothetical protein